MSVEFLLWVLSIIFCSLSENIAVLCSGSCNQGFVALFLNSIILKCFISFSQNAFLRLNIITIAISEVGNFYSYCFFQPVCFSSLYGRDSCLRQAVNKGVHFYLSTQLHSCCSSSSPRNGKGRGLESKRKCEGEKMVGLSGML